LTCSNKIKIMNPKEKFNNYEHVYSYL